MARILQIDQILTNLIHPVYNVNDDFNAVGDGVADDTAAIQAAVDAVPAAGGWVVGNPADTYLVKAPIQLKSNVKISGMKFKLGTTFTIPPGALNGRGGALELDDFGTTTTAIENVVIRDCSFDLTTATNTLISAINQADRPVQHLLIENCSFDLPGANIAAILLQELGASATVPSFDITIRHLYVHNGAGIQLLLNGVAATSKYHDVLIDDIVNLVDLGAVGDDRVAIAGNYPSGVGGAAEVYGITVSNIFVTIASGLTTGTVIGVKLDTGSNVVMHDILIDGISFKGNTNATVSQNPFNCQLGAGSGLLNYILRNVIAQDCGGIVLRAEATETYAKARAFVLVEGIRIGNCISATAGIEFFGGPAAGGNETLIIKDVSIRSAAVQAGNLPVGIMLTSGSAPQGWSGLISLCDIYLENWAIGVSNTIYEDGTTVASAHSNIKIRRVTVNGVTVTIFNMINTYDIRECRLFNPQGVAAIVVGASPFTYTAGPTPEIVHIDGVRGVAGTLTVVKNAITLYSIGNNEANRHAIPLEPGEAIVVTYTSGAGDTLTMNKDRK